MAMPGKYLPNRAKINGEPSGPETGHKVAVSRTGGRGEYHQNMTSAPSAISASRISAAPPIAAPPRPELVRLGGSRATLLLRDKLVHLAVCLRRGLEGFVDRLDLRFEYLLRFRD